MGETLGRVHSVESFGSADGPGVRYIVFLKGCNMRCKYCHNPDTWAKCGENDGAKLMTPQEVLKTAMRYKAYWKQTGGITVSGGEALLQIDFVTELFKLAKEKGVNTCLDTSGNPFTVEEPFFGKFNELMKYTDLFMLDIKHIDDEEHKKLTGQTNKNILDMAQYLSKNGKKMWIRHVLVPGITTDERYLKQLREFIDTLKTVERVEVLPYHTLGVFKWKELGIPYQLEGVEPPTKEQIECAKKVLPPVCINRIFDFRGGTCILREHCPIPAEVGRFLSALLSGHVPAACAFTCFDLARRIAVQFARITLALAELL